MIKLLRGYVIDLLAMFKRVIYWNKWSDVSGIISFC